MLTADSCVCTGLNLRTCGDTLTHLSNLQFSLVDQKGVHEASAHLWVERLIQMLEQLQVAFLNETVYVKELLPVCDPSKDPWEQVVHLEHTKKLRCLHQEREKQTLEWFMSHSTCMDGENISCKCLDTWLR